MVDRLRVVWDGHRAPAENMARDEAILSGPCKTPTLRIYGWSPPGLSLGYFQRNEDPAARVRHVPGVVVVRRPTGGGAILHRHEVTYCVALPSTWLTDRGPIGELRVDRSVEFLHEPLVTALEELGLEVTFPESPGETGLDSFFCFNRRASSDLLVSGRKVGGSAQRRTRDRILQHGSLLLRGDALIPGSTGINQELDATRNVDFDGIGRALVRHFATRLGLDPIEEPLGNQEVRLARSLEKNVYSDPDWRRRRSRP